MDSVHEVRVTAALHLPSEHPGLHRAADRGVLPLRNTESATERKRRALGAMDWLRARDDAPGTGARQGQPPGWVTVVLDRGHELSPFCRSPLSRVQRDPCRCEPLYSGAGA